MKSQTRSETFREEGEMHYRDSLVWRKLGGHKYGKILEAGKEYIRPREVSGKAVYIQVPQTEQWVDSLNSFLGEATSESCRSGRARTLNTFVNFARYEEVYDSVDLPRVREVILRTIFESAEAENRDE